LTKKKQEHGGRAGDISTQRSLRSDYPSTPVSEKVKIRSIVLRSFFVYQVERKKQGEEGVKPSGKITKRVARGGPPRWF